MAAVLTRLLPSTQSRLVGRTLEESNDETNTRAHKQNAQIPVDLAQASQQPDNSVEDEDEDMLMDETGAGEDEIRGSSQGESDVFPIRSDQKNTLVHSMRRSKSSEEPAREDSASEENFNSSDESTNAEGQWEGESDIAGDEQEIEAPDRHACIFCGQDEDEDPSEEFEEYMSCAVCGDNSHQQCAREANSLVSEEPRHWRCPTCVEIGVEPDDDDDDDDNDDIRASLQQRSSVPNIARDLLPASRGGIKPDSHSVFNTLILDDDPMDGSRSLRKRKSSLELTERQESTGRKRIRRSTAGSESIRDGTPSLTLRSRERTASDRSASHYEDDVGEDATRPRSSRLRQIHRAQKSLVTIVESRPDSLILSIALDPKRLLNLEHERKKARRRERDRARRARQAREQQIPKRQHQEIDAPHYPSIQATSFLPPLSMNDKDGEESKIKPYGGILSESEADTTRTFPHTPDRQRFEDARQRAEENWRKKIEASSAAEITRPSQKVSGPPSRIKRISFGSYEIDTWHAAPYPEEYSRNRVLYICEFCLKYMNSDYVAWRHKLKCPARHPPGDEIYRDESFSFFEVDGRKNPVYCQNLCLLAKLFLGSKTLYYDVEPFLFYIMTENDDFGCHFVGYFSKEKRPSSLNNVSCILVLPIHQRRGFGHMLIDFSYLLTRVEEKTGSPEKPLSDMGLVSYRSYWRLVLCQELLNQSGPLSINDLSRKTGMTADDIISALEGLRALVRDPVTKTYALRLDYAYFRQYIDNYEKKGYAKINPDALVWVPYIMGRDNQHYENAPQLHTVAQRDEAPSDVIPEEGVQMAANGIAENDYATSQGDTKSDAATTIVPTPQEELDRQLADPTTTQFAGADITDAMFQQSIALVADPVTPRAHTPKGNSDIPIPPARFEVFPPIPGTAARKKLGRGVRSTVSRRGTPLKRGENVTLEGPQSIPRPLSVRRTRSKPTGDDEEVNAEGLSTGIDGNPHSDVAMLDGEQERTVDIRSVDGEGDEDLDVTGS